MKNAFFSSCLCLLIAAQGFGATDTPLASQRLDVTMETIGTTASSMTVEATVTGEMPVLADDGDDSPTIATSGTLWALPYGTVQVNIVVEESSFRTLSAEEAAALDDRQVAGDDAALVAVSPVMRMRGVPIASIALNPLRRSPESGQVVLCEQVRFRAEYVQGGGFTAPSTLPGAFYEAMHGLVRNLDEIAGEPDRLPEPYLIITPPGYDGAALGDFAFWKRQKGHEVRVVTTATTGTTNSAILAYLQNEYDTAETPPVFVLLAGDVDGTNGLPTWQIPGYHTSPIESDHLYAQLDGDDFLPDILIGRFSVDTGFELQTVVNKAIRYEKTPFQPDGEWRSRMAIVGVKSTPSQFITYNSAWPTLRWVANEFIAWGYAEIDSVPYPGGQASQINAAINDGLSFLSYRGFGSPSDWAYPPYNIGQIGMVQNGEMLPVITSIVCGGGAFASSTDPCFGEAWLRKGTPTASGGAIGFIGPSELDTKTRWNNTITAGIYEGILHEGVSTLAGAMLRGKLELLREFPNNAGNHEADSNTSVSFYFRCYNLLGDPGLNFFVGPALEMTHTMTNTPQLGVPTLSLTVEDDSGPLRDARVTVSSDTDVFSRALTNGNGAATVSLPQDAPGTYDVIITRPRYEPQLFELPLLAAGVVIAASEISLRDDGTLGSTGNGDGVANPGERIALQVDLTNYGSAAFGGGTLSVTSSDDRLEPVTASQTVNALGAGGQQNDLLFLVDVSTGAAGEYDPALEWSVSSAGTEWQTTIDLAAPEITISDYLIDGIPTHPSPGTQEVVQFVLTNTGDAVMPACAANLISTDPRVQVLGAGASYSALPPGESAPSTDAGFLLEVTPMYPGEVVPLILQLSSPTMVRSVAVSLPIGNLTDNDPTAPDGYGYRAFDSGDSGYPEAPEFSWLEIDPTFGGPGSILPLTDIGEGYDAVLTMALPFPFSYYGVVYDEVSICTNGFIAMGHDESSYFRNYSIPAIASADRMIAPFWDDLVSGSGRVCTYHDDAGGRFVVQWSRMENAYSANPIETFQVVLHDEVCWPTQTDDGDILFQYHAISNTDAWDNFATIGIQDRRAGFALPLSYAATSEPGMRALRSGQAILITTGRSIDGPYAVFDGNLIDDDDEGESQGNSDGIAQNGETIELSIQIANIGTENLPAATGTITEMDPAVELMTSSVSFPAIQAGETAPGSPVVVSLSPAIPDNHFVNFSVTFGEGTLPCVVLPSLTVTGPVLFSGGLTVDDDDIGGSNGNDNGEFNPNETLELFPSVTNSGQNTAYGVTAVLSRQNNNVQIVDGTVEFGDIEADTQVTAEEAFVVHVPSSVGNAYPIELTVTLTDDYGTTWSRFYSYVVAQAQIKYASIRIADPPPGGNGNGDIDPGETVELYPSIRNTGIGSATNTQLEIVSVTAGSSVQSSTLQIGTVSGNSLRESDTPIVLDVGDEVSAPSNIRLETRMTSDETAALDFEIAVIVGDARFFDDFEAHAADGWSTYGTEDLWNKQLEEFYSPGQAYYCGIPQTHEYPPYADAYLRSRPFVFTGDGTLIVATKYDIPDNADRARIDLQWGVTNYAQLASLNGADVEWHQLEFSLAGIPASGAARIRFWFSSNASTQGGGWYVDDVLVLDPPSSVPTTPDGAIPTEVALRQNYPNPFNSRTTFEYSIPLHTRAVLTLYNIEGRRVATLLDEAVEPGTYRLGWQPLSLASGLYFVRLEAAGHTVTRKIAYLR